jgi:adenosylcobinamide-phosphate synthase
MSFLALLIALALEQWHPLVERRFVVAPMSGYADALERNLDAGEAQQGLIAWMLAVLPVGAAAWGAHAALTALNPLLGLAFDVGVLYLTMGFRQHSHFFTDIQRSLKDGALDEARRLLGEWRGHSCQGLRESEVARLTMEGALTVAHRHVFGPIFWFVLLPGPSGAVMYRLALFLSQRWGGASRAGYAGPIFDFDVGRAAAADAPSGESRFGEFARVAFRAIDWLPARFTAATFAIVGDFEDAIYCWRTQAARWPDEILGVVLAAGAGALGVRLGMPVPRGPTLEDRPELGLGDDADPGFLDGTVGLIWRALVFWLGMLLLLSLVRTFG